MFVKLRTWGHAMLATHTPAHTSTEALPGHERHLLHTNRQQLWACAHLLLGVAAAAVACPVDDSVRPVAAVGTALLSPASARVAAASGVPALRVAPAAVLQYTRRATTNEQQSAKVNRLSMQNGHA
eukprot:TRINITY_DN5813_c0_g1_i3.p2 TRINITY_DN5813_c0_g1~~TRINITY_DN5813_c0_g1_i3.p2  ORF type:complete len:126 (+),score=7.96 TRINITY_DN5813_c0_g1_i3:127-504(+)